MSCPKSWLRRIFLIHITNVKVWMNVCLLLNYAKTAEKIIYLFIQLWPSNDLFTNTITFNTHVGYLVIVKFVTYRRN